MDDIYDYKYDNFSNLAKVMTNNDVYLFNYDFAQRISSYRYNDLIINYNYDIYNNIVSKNFELDNNYEVINYTYDKENSITNVSYDNNDLNYLYDELGRLKETNINGAYNINYKYVTKGKKTSLLLESIKDDNNEFKYNYDKVNNITGIVKNNVLINGYEYDNLNELVKEYDYQNNSYTDYIYDNSGNMLSKKIYDSNDILLKEDILEYNNLLWIDQLTKYNNDVITYDNIGNPLTIGNNISLEWTNGRELKQYNDVGKVIKYKYNKDGVRISKDVNNVKTMYYVENNQIIFEKINDNVIYYLREVNNKLLGFKYNNNMYYYMKNPQEDIIGILDSNLNVIVNYEYDSWGKVVSVKDALGNVITDLNNIGHINPFRYRSYYYDNETGLYYLNSRYYNPIWGRFINADNMLIQNNTAIIANNLYIYAYNNPINMKDFNGNIPKWLEDLGNGVKNIGKKIVDSASKIINNDKKIVKKVTRGIEKIAKSIFGAEMNNTVQYNSSSNVQNILFSVENGTNYNLLSSTGDSSKPISVYTNNVNNSITDYSIGLKVNVFNANVKLNLSLSDISVSVGVYNNNNNSTNSVALGISLTKFNVFGSVNNNSYIDDISNIDTYGRVDASLAIPIIIWGVASGFIPLTSSFSY